MFAKIPLTEFPPTQPTLVWDGTCGFCKFWKTRWELQAKGKIKFVTYQEEAHKYPDIPIKEFKKSSRLIEPDGKVYSGPDSAFRSLYYGRMKNWHYWYTHNSLFQKICDKAYNHIAKNRSFYYKVTTALFGKDPKKLKPYWFAYLFIILALIVIIWNI